LMVLRNQIELETLVRTEAQRPDGGVFGVGQREDAIQVDRAGRITLVIGLPARGIGSPRRPITLIWPPSKYKTWPQALPSPRLKKNDNSPCRGNNPSGSKGATSTRLNCPRKARLLSLSVPGQAIPGGRSGWPPSLEAPDGMSASSAGVVRTRT